MTAAPPSDDASPQLLWADDGSPRSGRFGDVYFSKDDGLAETRAVFLQGCGLPEAWSGRSAFTVGELGFGTGLNIVALLDRSMNEEEAAREDRPAMGETTFIIAKNRSGALADVPLTFLPGSTKFVEIDKQFRGE